MESWAKSQQLVSTPATFEGVDDNAGRPLRTCADGALEALLHKEFRPSPNRPQLDLFLDHSTRLAAGELIEALADGDARASEGRLQRLARIDPQHWALRDAAALAAVLRSPPRGEQDALAQVDAMQRRWRPAALALLGERANDFLAPLWQAIALALAQRPFDAAEPHRHASWAHLQAGDWQAVRSSVEAVPDYRAEPQLLARLAEAEWRLGQHAAARQLWFELCWGAAGEFQELIESGRFPDALLSLEWRRMRTEGDAPFGPPAWLPAWLAMRSPGLVATIEAADARDPPQRAFDRVRALAARGSDRQDIDNRRALQAIHQGLLNQYLAWREA